MNFFLIFEDLRDEVDVYKLLNRMISNTSKIKIENQYEVTLSVSAGISIYPDHGNNVNDLIRSADKALYQAKKNGKGKIQVYCWSNENFG